MSSNYTPGTFSGSQYTQAALTAEFQKLKVALDECLQRVQGTGNEMEAELDMNSQRIINAAAGVNPGDVATVQNLTDALASAGDLAALQAAVDQLEADLASNDIFTANSRARIVDNEADIAALQGLTGQLQTDLGVAEQGILGNDLDIASLQTQINNLSITSGSYESIEITVYADAGGDLVADDTITGAASRQSVIDAAVGDFITVRWAGADGTLDATQPRLQVDFADNSGADIYELRRPDNTPLQDGDFAFGDQAKFAVVQDSGGGQIGILRAVISVSYEARLDNLELSTASNTAAIAAETSARTAAVATVATDLNTAETLLASTVTDLNAAEGTLATTVTDLTALTADVNSRPRSSQEWTVGWFPSSGPNGRFQSVSGATAEAAAALAEAGGTINIRWNPVDGSTSAVFAGNTPEVRVVDAGNNELIYQLQRSDGNDIGAGDIEPGDSVDFYVISQAVPGTPGLLRSVQQPSQAVDTSQIEADLDAVEVNQSAMSAAIAGINTTLNGQSADLLDNIARAEQETVRFSFQGVLPDNTAVARFIPEREFELASSPGPLLYMATPPLAGGASFDIKSNGTTIMTMTVPEAATSTSTFTVPAGQPNPPQFLVNTIITVEAVAQNSGADAALRLTLIDASAS